MTSSSQLPGVSVGEKPRRFVPRFHWELLACGVDGHELVGLDARDIRPDDAPIVREHDGVRWYRCLRCDSWLPLLPPEEAQIERDHLPPLDGIELPLRGKPLRDKIVLRVIAVDRAFHFVVLGLLAVAVFLFASHQQDLHDRFYRVLDDLQTAFGGNQSHGNKHGLLHSIDQLFTLQSSKLRLAGAGIAAYALLEGLEAVGLWYQKRWAEYLTFIATTALLPLEVYELTHTVSPFKIVALIVNLAIVVYLLFAKRLFGLRGGGAAEEELRQRDVGVEALLRATP
ncbi:MAG TPA: DUF2127 domain-containing protein [Thermoleophilaceae bacterium]|jgi:uncharacterized membrane protein (DUF2068 family)|nr:DUF2127 domain-containing protein [Thermoleophilaceae bacterium]